MHCVHTIILARWRAPLHREGMHNAETFNDPLISEDDLFNIFDALSKELFALGESPPWAVPRTVSFSQLRRQLKSFVARNPTPFFIDAFRIYFIEIEMRLIEMRRGEATPDEAQASVVRWVNIGEPPNAEPLGDVDGGAPLSRRDLGGILEQMSEKAKAFDEPPHSAVHPSVSIRDLRRRVNAFRVKNPTLQFGYALSLFLLEGCMNQIERQRGTAEEEAQTKCSPAVRRTLRNRRIGRQLRRRGQRTRVFSLSARLKRRGNPCS